MTLMAMWRKPAKKSRGTLRRLSRRLREQSNAIELPTANVLRKETR